MRVSLALRMASSSPITASGLKRTPMALLPPLPLYRRLLRAHRKLPQDIRLLGDQYVKSEFRAHQKVENPIHIIGFLTEWQLYAQKLEGDSWAHEKLDKAKIDKMSDQQIGQLYELMLAARNHGRGEEES